MIDSDLFKDDSDDLIRSIELTELDSAKRAKNNNTTNNNMNNTTTKRRVRTGCFNCRRKHKKCDEVKPVCNSCTIKNEVCEWPANKSSGTLHNDPPLDYPAKRQRLDSLPPQKLYAPNQQSIPPHYVPTGVHVPQSYQINWGLVPQPLPITELSRKLSQDAELKPIYETLEDLFIRFLVDPEPITSIPAPQLLIAPLDSFEEIITMKSYIHTISPQLDWVNIDTDLFKVDIPHLTRSSNVLRNALYALSLVHQSNELSNPNPIPTNKMLSIFEKSVLELVQDSQQGTTSIRICSALFLMLFCTNFCRDVSKSKTLVSALLTYLQREGVHPRDKSPINHCIYWSAIFLDINSTKVFEESTLVAHDYENLEGLGPVPRILSYLSMTFNLLELNQPQTDFDLKWEKIWNSLMMYVDELISSKDRNLLGPIMDRADDKSPFPMVLQSSPAAVLFQQFYLIVKILLIQDRPRIFKNKYNDSHQAAWYAKRLCSISIWNKEYINWLSTPLALSIAGKVLTHEDEHQAIITMLDEIKTNSGFILKYGKQELLEFWGE